MAYRVLINGAPHDVTEPDDYNATRYSVALASFIAERWARAIGERRRVRYRLTDGRRPVAAGHIWGYPREEN